MRVKSSNKTLAFAILAASVVAIGISATPIAIKFRGEGAHFSGFIAVLSFFMLVGVLLLWLGATYMIRWLRYGEAVMELPDEGGRVGHVLKATLYFSRPFEPTGPMVLNPRCVQRRVIQTGRGSERSQRTDITVLWRGETEMRVIAAQMQIGIPIEIALPAEAPKTSGSPNESGILWQLEVTIPAQPVDFHGSFDFPVYQPDVLVGNRG